MAQLIIEMPDPALYLPQVLERAYEIAQNNEYATINLTDKELKYLITKVNGRKAICNEEK